jgi:hypothetical protein
MFMACFQQMTRFWHILFWALVQKKVRVAISQSSQNHRSMSTPSILNRTTTGETTLNPQGRNL